MDVEVDSGAEIIPGHKDVASFTQSSLQIIAKAIKASNALPSDKKKDWDYYSILPAFRMVMNAEKNLSKDMIEKILKINGIKNAKFASPNELIENLTEANDQLLETINSNLDIAAGIKKDTLLIEVKPEVRYSGSWNNKTNENSTTNMKLVTAKHVMRPQIKFQDKIDNSTKPFVPSLKEKPNAKKPLSILMEYDDNDESYYSHPYLYELNLFQPELEDVRTKTPGNFPPDLNEATLVIVDNKAKLEKMMEYLRSQTELSVDLEHHWYRSFQGITSLIQISSWERDFIIDPFDIWSELVCLNEVFTDPKVVKVFHGADQDLMWLQRDFSVYVVNLFDTHQAAIMLNYPAGSRSYSSLLKKYCDIDTDKKFQLSDWRLRPLPQDMIEYARKDSRFLLYIYRQMSQELFKAGNEFGNILLATINICTDMCKKSYRKPVLRHDSHMNLVVKSRASFNSRQQFAVQQIYKWRHKTAREEDESEQFVLPNHMLLKICTELPREMQGILACCNPTPPLVKQNLQHLHLTILKAREQALSVIKHDIEHTPSIKTPDKVLDIAQDVLKSPLDLTHGLPEGENLLDSHSENVYVKLRQEPVVQIFQQSKKSKKRNHESTQDCIKFVGPYKRHAMLIPYLKHLSEKEVAEKDNITAHADQVRSIREHFDALTAMTAEEYTQERNEEVVEPESEPGEEEVDEHEDEELIENGPVQPLRSNSSSKKLNRKRKKNQNNQNPQPSTSTQNPNGEDDFGQFSKKGKFARKLSDKVYDPWKNFNQGKTGKKAKQKFNKSKSRSHSYKK